MQECIHFCLHAAVPLSEVHSSSYVLVTSPPLLCLLPWLTMDLWNFHGRHDKDSGRVPRTSVIIYSSGKRHPWTHLQLWFADKNWAYKNRLPWVHSMRPAQSSNLKPPYKVGNSLSLHDLSISLTSFLMQTFSLQSTHPPLPMALFPLKTLRMAP